MSDDEQDFELLELLRKSLGLNDVAVAGPAETRVLESAEHIYKNSVDVAIDMRGTKAAATTIRGLMEEKEYSCKTWSEHELHPKVKEKGTVDFVFTMDLLNFSFWSDCSSAGKRYLVEYAGRRWTGYWSLVAALQRALEEGMSTISDRVLTWHLTIIGIPITSPGFWVSQCYECTSDTIKHVLRSVTLEDMPLMEDRISCLQEAGQILIDVSFIQHNLN